MQDRYVTRETNFIAVLSMIAGGISLLVVGDNADPLQCSQTPASRPYPAPASSSRHLHGIFFYESF
jgi:hypothetical protein